MKKNTIMQEAPRKGKRTPRGAANLLRTAGCAILAVLLTGCATTERRLTPLYHPAVYAVGGSGNLYLTAAAGKSGGGETESRQWIIGKVKNGDGGQVGDVVTSVAPSDLILDALNQELTRAGYKVIRTSAMPGEVANGVAVTTLGMNLEEVSSIMKAEGTTRLTVSLELWKNGKKFKKLDYETGFSDSAVMDRDLLLPATLQKALQNLMEQAIPEIIKNLGG